MDNFKRIVQKGYDQLGDSYRIFYEKTGSTRYTTWLTDFVQLLPPHSNVLELGCGDGIPTAHYLSEYVDYLGIDISAVQIELARLNVPEVRFEVNDMSVLFFPNESFNGIVALYSIIHLPLSEQPTLFESLYNWLTPNGYLLCIVGADHWTDTDDNWIKPGVCMYWSHTDAATYQEWFTQLGFIIVDKKFIPEGNGGHTYFLVRK